VYRFISKSIVMAYDDRQRLTLNSANMVIPRVDGYPIKAVLALFNSVPYQYIFQKKYFSIKVLREHIEQLPLPLLDRGVLRRMVVMADEIIEGRGSLEEMDDFIMDQFLLKTAERIHIRRSVGQDTMIRTAVAVAISEHNRHGDPVNRRRETWRVKC
jgi:hypothetical protein